MELRKCGPNPEQSRLRQEQLDHLAEEARRLPTDRQEALLQSLHRSPWNRGGRSGAEMPGGREKRPSTMAQDRRTRPRPTRTPLLFPTLAEEPDAETDTNADVSPAAGGDC